MACRVVSQLHRAEPGRDHCSPPPSSSTPVVFSCHPLDSAFSHCLTGFASLSENPQKGNFPSPYPTLRIMPVLCPSEVSLLLLHLLGVALFCSSLLCATASAPGYSAMQSPSCSGEAAFCVERGSLTQRTSGREGFAERLLMD